LMLLGRPRISFTAVVMSTCRLLRSWKPKQHQHSGGDVMKN
jgi:hypothetical protein